MMPLFKVSGVSNMHAKAVKEYSCVQDPNITFRPYMEDCIFLLW